MGFNWWREAEPDGMSVQDIVDRVQADGELSVGVPSPTAPDPVCTTHPTSR
ncbi:hypothetical protein [Nocardia sp. XZ_19_369]|uniref:hypothetical protein n=1 Tax=Nocardia sp. XZ_19_369 TaxID=2769487 RepID=UPI00188FCEA1|nr:hypothetical protein [Nocardia sp. XZ_19_369]